MNESNPFADDAPPPNAQNPYAAPQTPTALPGDAQEDWPTAEFLRKFRQQTHALGALWIILGALAAVAVTVMAAFEAPAAAWPDNAALLAVLIPLTLLWIVIGVFTLMKHLWAIYTGLVLSYLSLIGNVFTLNICAIAILLAVILQAHRVLGWAQQLRRAGIPLTVAP